MRHFKFLFAVLLISSVIGCASTSVKPVTENKPTEQVIDPVYIRTQADYHYALGEALSMDGESERAIEEFKLTTVYDPQSATVRLRLAGEYLRQGLMTEAVEQAELALEYEPDNEDVRAFLGGIYVSLKMYNQALVEYQHILAKNPRHLKAPLYIGALYAEQQKYDEAEKYFLKVATPENEDAYQAYYYIGRMRSSQPNGFKRAEKAFKESLSLKPDFEDGVLALADLYMSNQQDDKGVKLLESFQDQYGPRKMVAFQLGQHYLSREQYDKALRHLYVLETFEPGNLNVKMKIALILIEKKDFDGAIPKLEEILTLAPSADKVRFWLGAIYEERKDYIQAAFHYKKVEATSANYPEAVVRAAQMYKRADKIDEAMIVLEKGIEQRNDVPNFYAYYAALLDERKEYHKGIKILEAAVNRFGDNTELQYYLGSLYDRVGRRTDSMNMMKKVLAIEAEHVQALNFLAYTYAELSQNLAEAEKMALRAMELQPNDGYILDTVGWVYFKQGQTAEAIRYLEAAHKLKPDESVVAEHLGDAYYVFELSEKAREMYLKAVAVEKDEAKINYLRSKIVSIERAQKGARMPASVKGVTGDDAPSR